MEIGRVIGTERKPNTAYTFSFWTDPTAPVGIGALVKVVTDLCTVYGTVVEAHGFNDLESPLHEFLCLGGEPNLTPPTHRPEIRVFQAAVLRREPEEPIGAAPIGPVFLANEADVRMALRTDAFVDEHGIPCGCYGPKDAPIAVHVDSRFLLGPEAGHLNITGTSGLAAKTSFILWLLRAIFDHHKDEDDGRGDKGVAAILFNTKGGDLLYIDRDPLEDLGKDGLDDLDHRQYGACRVTDGPFKKVRYFAPFEKDGVNINSLRRNEELDEQNPTMPFTFGLKDIVKHAEVLLNKDDLDAKADAYLEYLNDRFIEGEGHQIDNEGERLRADSLDDLLKIVNRQIEHCERNGKNSIDTHHPHTIRKMRNRLSGLVGRFSGLIAEKTQPVGPFDTPFEPETVYVIDVSRLASEEQDLVFAAFITKLQERMEEQQLGVGRMIVMVDELNKYAPSSGSETYVLKSLKEIAARGRYLGLTLFGAQQFRSRVDKEVVGNAATHAFGHVEAEELAQPGYSYFSPAIKEKLGSLSPGEVLIKHPHFTQPIFIRFPKPAIVKGGDGLRRFPQTPARTEREIILTHVRRLRGNPNTCMAALDELSPERQNLLTVLRELRRMEPGDDPLEAFKKGKKTPLHTRREPMAVITGDAHDPFADI